MHAASVLQSVLAPAGPQAAHIARLWWLMFWVATAVFVIVSAFVVGAIVWKRTEPRRDDVLRVAVTLVGASGTVPGVTGAEGRLGVPRPAAVRALTVKV